LGTTFLPIVTNATEKVGLLDKYNEFAGKATGFGLVKKEDANIQQYVTGKSLDGLYRIIGEEEKKIRCDPVGAGNAILKRVFGALKQVKPLLAGVSSCGTPPAQVHQHALP